MLFNKSVQSAAASYNRNRRFDYDDYYGDPNFPIVPFCGGIILFIIVVFIILNAFA